MDSENDKFLSFTEARICSQKLPQLNKQLESLRFRAKLGFSTASTAPMMMTKAKKLTNFSIFHFEYRRYARPKDQLMMGRMLASFKVSWKSSVSSL